MNPLAERQGKLRRRPLPAPIIHMWKIKAPKTAAVLESLGLKDDVKMSIARHNKYLAILLLDAGKVAGKLVIMQGDRYYCDSEAFNINPTGRQAEPIASSPSQEKLVRIRNIANHDIKKLGLKRQFPLLV